MVELSTTEKTILALLQTALTGRSVELPSDADWDAVFTEAEIQAIVPLAGSALPASVPEANRRKWELDAGQQLIHYLELLEEQDRLTDVFQTAGIPMMILKGTAAAIYYPDPSLRNMGDVDLIVPQERFDDAMELMISRGYTLRFLEEDHLETRHRHFQRGNVIFELHHRFSGDIFDMDSYIRESLPHPAEGEVEGHRFPMPPALANGVVLLSHMCQHLRIKMGLRQVLDWMMYVRNVLDDDFWKTCFQPAAAQLGVEKFAAVVTRMCQKYLGLDESITWCSGADEALCDELLGVLFRSGNFARKLGRESSMETVMNGFKRRGVFAYLQKQGLSNLKYAKNRSWPRPLAWLYQIFHYIRMSFRRKLTLGQMREETGKSRRYSEFLYELGLE